MYKRKGLSIFHNQSMALLVEHRTLNIEIQMSRGSITCGVSVASFYLLFIKVDGVKDINYVSVESDNA